MRHHASYLVFLLRKCVALFLLRLFLILLNSVADRLNWSGRVGGVMKVINSELNSKFILHFVIFTYLHRHWINATTIVDWDDSLKEVTRTDEKNTSIFMCWDEVDE